MTMNTTNDLQIDEEQLEHHHVVPLLLTYSLIILVGVIGNISLMMALISSGAQRLRTPQLLSVCVADLLVSGVAAPIATARSLATPPYKPLQGLSCQLANYIEIFPITASTLLLATVAIDRYVTVQRPRILTEACSRPLLATCGVWCCALMLSAAASHAPCTQPHLTLFLEAVHIILAFFLPIFIVISSHLSVRARLTALSLTARAAHGELPLPVPLIRRPTHVIIVTGVGAARERRDAFDAGDRRKSKGRAPQPSLLGPQPLTSTLRSRRRLANVLVAVAAMFATCWCPHAFVMTAGALGATPPLLIRRYALLLGHAHSALHATAYWILNRHALSAACGAWKLPDLLRPQEERPSSTNEANLGAFHPRLTRPAPAPRPPPSSFLY